MSAIQIFAATTGLQPFSINRVSLTLALTIAALVIAKLVNAYLFCGFNVNVYMELPFGVVLFAGYCIMPLLGLAVNRRPETKRGRYCRTFAILLINIWLAITWGGTLINFECVGLISFGNGQPELQRRERRLPFEDRAELDPFSVCGNRTRLNVRAQFSNAMPTYDVLRRIDLVYKILAGLGWLFPIVFAATAHRMFFLDRQPQGKKEDRQPLEDLEAGRSDDIDETIISMEEGEEGRAEEFAAAAKLETIDEVSDQPATIDIECESPVFGAAEDAGQSKTDRSLEDRMAEDAKSSDSSDNDAEP